MNLVEKFFRLQKKLSDIIIEKISPISKEIRNILEDKETIDTILLNGAQKAEKLARIKVNEIKKIVGF